MTRKKVGRALARETLEGRLVGGKFSQLASYSDLFERSQDGILFVDVRNYEILETNRSFRDLIESDRSREGASFFDLFTDGESDRVQDWLRNPTSALSLETADGRTIEFSGAKVRLADYCEVFQVLARDVTKERVRQNLLERQSLTDEMTGLSNFRAFQAQLVLEHDRAVNDSKPYCVVFFDVDHFKHFNDQNGHPAGDETLRLLAQALKKVSRRSEFVARYGGEEFVVLLSGAELEVGRVFAERARQEIEKIKFPHGEKQPLGKITVSVGVAPYEKGVSAEVILKRADEALYESKKAGRNRVTTYLTGKKAVTYLLKKVG